MALFMGRIEKVLIEEETLIGKNTYLIGHNERYLKLAIPMREEMINQIIDVKINKKLTDEVLLCDMI